MTVAKTPFKLKVAMPDILENAEANLTPRMRNLVNLLWSERKDLEQSVVGMNQEIEQIASSDPTCQQLRQIPVTARWWHRDRGSDRQRRSLPQGPRVLLLGGACAAAALDWRESEAIWHQQAREHIFAQAPRACRPIRCSPD
ncbi:MAG TPA: hypothetical protein VNU92_15570 [Edaphobacter sp.]|jgi:hypothetical protein|nr:hypothetical protein [Edaphobacter sp.]